MLIELIAENVAVMERAQLSFGSGFTAITGETGAGKSLLVGSISLCLGERADSDIVRTGASRAIVQAVFDPPLITKELLAELGYEGDDGLLYIQREIAAEGRSQCRINGRLAPLTAVKRIGDTLADLHGQHEHQSLLNPDNHLAILDAWIGTESRRLLEEIASTYTSAASLRRQLQELERDGREREQRLDMLRFQITEIESISPSVGEIAELEARLTRLKYAESLASSIESASSAAFSGEVSAKDLLAQAVHSMEAASEIDPRLAETSAALNSALFQLEDAVAGLRAAQDGIEFSPEQAEQISERLDQLARLRRKYGDTESEMLEFLERARESLDTLENAEAGREQTEDALEKIDTQLRKLCEKLTSLRLARATEFCGIVARELHDLAMPDAELSFKMAAKEPSADGADDFEFFFSANPGESEKPLAKIASGGEISRVMLAIKTALAGKGGVPTLVFDEVDSGLGGHAAAIVAKKLEKLAENYQIIVITHVPQIAGRASAQISISKRTLEGRAVTSANALTNDERVEEISRMLAGETVGAAAIENAKHLLEKR